MALPGPPTAPADDPEGTRGGEEAEESPSRPHSSDSKSQRPELTFCSFDLWNSSTSLHCLIDERCRPRWATPKLQYIPFCVFVSECGKQHNLHHRRWVEQSLSAAEAAGDVWGQRELRPSFAWVLLDLAGSKYWHVIPLHVILAIPCYDVVCDALVFALDYSDAWVVVCYSQAYLVGLRPRIDFYILLDNSTKELELFFSLVI